MGVFFRNKKLATRHTICLCALLAMDNGLYASEPKDVEADKTENQRPLDALLVDTPSSIACLLITKSH